MKKPSAAQLRAKKLAEGLKTCRHRYRRSKARARCEASVRKRHRPVVAARRSGR